MNHSFCRVAPQEKAADGLWKRIIPVSLIPKPIDHFTQAECQKHHILGILSSYSGHCNGDRVWLESPSGYLCDRDSEHIYNTPTLGSAS
jgi:hypothetical protein